MRGSGLGSCEDTIEIRFDVTEGDIVRNRVVKEMVLLQNHSDMSSDIAVVQRSKINVVEGDRSFGWLQQTGEEFNQRCFPGTAPPGKRNHLSGANVQIDIAEDVGRFRTAIFETNTPQLDSPFQTVNRH